MRIIEAGVVNLISIMLPPPAVYTHALLIFESASLCLERKLVAVAIHCPDSITFAFNACAPPLVIGTWRMSVYLQNSAVNLDPTLAVFYYEETLIVRGDPCNDPC
jgi:hypothetical protein